MHFELTHDMIIALRTYNVHSDSWTAEKSLPQQLICNAENTLLIFEQKNR